MHQVTHFFKQLWDALRGLRSSRSIWITLFITLIAESVTVLLAITVHQQMVWIHLILIPIALSATAYGHHDEHLAPLAKLVREPNAPKAPFMVAKAIELSQILDPEHVHGESKRAGMKRADNAVDAFRTELRALKEVFDVRPQVAALIREGSVWAVCGRKDPETAEVLYEACKTSVGEGHHIERVFFPPDTKEDAAEIFKAIKLHLAACMTVRVFRTHAAAATALYGSHLPRGFGMTWIDSSNQLATGKGAERTPLSPRSAAVSVLVHWGGLTADNHPCVVMQNNADWAQHLWELCRTIQSAAVVANANGPLQVVKLSPKKFLRDFPIYRKPRRRP